MRAWMGCLVAAALAVGVCGCDRSGRASANRPNIGAVAVIDLDRVAQKLGRDVQMAQLLQQRQVALNEQLTAIKVSYEQEISEKQSQFGSAPSQEQTQLLSTISQQAGANLNRVQQQAKNDLNQHRAGLIQQFREEVKPVARQVALERGLSLIVTKNDNVIFDFASAVDITNDVIQRMQQRPPQSNTPTSQP